MKPSGSIPLLVVVFSTVAGAATAQPIARLEVGAQASLLRHSRFDATNLGLGGRVSFDLAPWAAVEGEASFFPDDDVLLPPSSFNPDLRVIYQRRRTEAFFGVKLGRRFERYGLFAKVRPGFSRITGAGGPRCVGTECAFILLVVPEYRTEFALDLGGVFEVYPTARTVARFELGDTMIRHRSTAPPCWGTSCTSHNLSSGLGVGLRF
jgi:hypothetical protein